jgi:hypothetical protein
MYMYIHARARTHTHTGPCDAGGAYRGGREGGAKDTRDSGGDSACNSADLSSCSHVQFNPQTVAGVPAKAMAKLLAPKPAMCGHDLQVTIDELVFLGHPTVVDQKQQAPPEGSSEAAARPFREMLTTFTLVLVVQAGSMHICYLSPNS